MAGSCWVELAFDGEGPDKRASKASLASFIYESMEGGRSMWWRDFSSHGILMSPANIKGLQKGRDKKETTTVCSSVIPCTFCHFTFILVNFYHNSNRSALREAPEIHHHKQSHFYGIQGEAERCLYGCWGKETCVGCWCSRKTATASRRSGSESYLCFPIPQG